MLPVFENLRNLVNVIAAFARLESAIVDELESQSRRLYALEQNQAMAKSTRTNLMIRLSKAERAVFGADQAPEKPTETALVKA